MIEVNGYFGWERPDHAAGCARPAWDVTVRERADEVRLRRGGAAHDCPGHECGHGGRYDEVTVRLVCWSCGAARVITGEQSAGRTRMSAAELGYGTRPRRVRGLYLWPCRPLLEGGPPTGYLVTAADAVPRVPGDLVAAVQQGRGPRGGLAWSALAVPDPAGGYGGYVTGGARFAAAVDGLRSEAAAVRWIVYELGRAAGAAGDGAAGAGAR